MVQQAVHTLVQRVVVRHHERRVRTIAPDWPMLGTLPAAMSIYAYAGHMHHTACTKKTLHERNWRLPCGGQESLPQEKAAARCDHVSERFRLDRRSGMCERRLTRSHKSRQSGVATLLLTALRSGHERLEAVDKRPQARGVAHRR